VLGAIRAAKKRLHGGIECPACGRLILIEETVVRYRGQAHHERCVVYKSRRRPSGGDGSLRSP
jgi:hypothetical protein